VDRSMRNLPGHDIIVVGASAGGIDPLQQLCQDLPADLPAAVFIVVHVGIRSHLADILDRRAALPVVTAESGMAVAPGTVYVAAPGKHLLLHDGHVLLRRGPRENMARPAVDPLFRSAAASYGSRVVGVILSGALNDGTAGLRAIKRCGGVTVVQEPTEAIEPSMPRSAMRHVAVDHIPPATDLAALLYRLAQGAVAFRAGERRCHVGHAYTADAVVEAGSLEIDKMMETLLRSHRERAALVHHMAKQERGLHNDSLARQLEARAKEYDEDAELVRQLARHPTFRGRGHDGGEAGDILTNEAAQETQA